MNNDTQILESFENILPPYKTTSTGWKTFNCPECGDTRGRGAFLVTGTGGFRYHCFNGGCSFSEQPTGWEPGNGVGGRPRRLYQLLGGRLQDLPLQSLFQRSDSSEKEPDHEIVRNFPAIELPKGSVPLIEPGAHVSDKNFVATVDYAFIRFEEIVESANFHWSPKYPKFLIVPYYHYGRIVGYLARSIEGNVKFQKNSSDYLFNQESLDKEGRSVLLLEGVLDAKVVDGVGARGSKLTQKQINLLNLCGRDIIVVPDQEKEGTGFIETAKEQNWYTTTPAWDNNIKDVAQAVQQYGRLYVIEDLVRNRHKNYLKSLISVSMKDAVKKKIQ